MEEENIYTHIEDTMSNIYLNGNMLNSGTVMVMLKEKDQRIKELESQINITKLELYESHQDFEKLKRELTNLDYIAEIDHALEGENIDLEKELVLYKKQCHLLQKALTLAIKKLKMCGYWGNEKEIIKEVKKC